VEGYTSGKTLTFTIYGKETRPANRTLKFESQTLQRIDPGAPAEQVDNSLMPGQKVKVQSSHTGLRSQLYKCVYVDGERTERTLLNADTYNASKAIYRVGPAAPAAAPVEETPAAPEPTQPAETAAAPTEPAPAETQPLGPGYEYGPGMPAPTEAPAPAEPVPAPAETPAPVSPAEGPGGE